MPNLTDDALDQLFCKARSFNGYTTQAVLDPELLAIWNLAKYGPTSANSLPARIIWVRSEEAKTTLAAMSSAPNATKIMSAPVTAIVGMDMMFYDHLPELFPHADARAWFVGNQPLIEETAIRNSSLQGAYLMFAARALGLDCGPMSGFDSLAVDAHFFAETTIKSNFLCTIGHGDPETVFDRLPRPPFEKFNWIV